MIRAARRLADCWDANIGPPPKKEWYNGHQALEMALVRFAHLVDEVEGSGRGDRYIALSKFLLDSRRDGSEYDHQACDIPHDVGPSELELRCCSQFGPRPPAPSKAPRQPSL